MDARVASIGLVPLLEGGRAPNGKPHPRNRKRRPKVKPQKTPKMRIYEEAQTWLFEIGP